MPDIQTLLDIAAFLDPHFKDLDAFVAVTDKVHVEEFVKLEMLAVRIMMIYIVEQVTSTREQNQPDEQISCLERAPPKTKGTTYI